MDAIKFINEETRMCESFGTTCVGCPMHPGAKKARYDCRTFVRTCAEQAVDIVEQWSKEHPVVTNEMKFLEVFGVGYGKAVSDGLVEFMHKEYKEPKGESDG